MKATIYTVDGRAPTLEDMRACDIYQYNEDSDEYIRYTRKIRNAADLQYAISVYSAIRGFDPGAKSKTIIFTKHIVRVEYAEEEEK